MDFRLPSAELKKIVKKLSLANSVNIVIDGAKGTMLAADETLGVEIEIPALKGIADAPIAVQARMFSSVLSGLSGEVRFERADGPIRISTGKSQFELVVVPPKKLVTFRPEGTETAFPAKEFSEALTYAGSVSGGSQVFDFTGCVLVTAPQGMISAAGTDRHRMAVYDTKISAPKTTRILIPVRAVKAIKDLDEKEIFFSDNGRMQFFRSGVATVFSKNVTGEEVTKFPDPYKFIPREYNIETLIDAEELKSALRRIGPVIEAEEDTKRRKVVFTFDGDTLRLTAGNSLGKAQDSVSMETTKPDVFEEPLPFRMTVNHRDLLDFCEAVTGTITFQGRSPMEPVWLQAGNKKLLDMPFR
jgi:DNA polymerase III sliding clamp (beta) subunit (PCNA family)